MIYILEWLYSVLAISAILFLWTSIIRDLAQIRAAQKIEIEVIANLEKLLNEERKDEDEC